MENIKTIAELDAFIEKNGVVLIDFYATWCGPCKIVAPLVTKLAQEKHIALAKVDVDEGGELAQKYEISAMPTFVVVTKNGVALKKQGGADALKECIQKALTLK